MASYNSLEGSVTAKRQLRLRPVYVVLFSASDWESEYVPVLTQVSTDPNGTSPHQLDGAIVPALAGLHFAQRLPRSLFELADFPIPFLLDGHEFARPHDIRLMPEGAFPELLGLDADVEIPILTIAPDDVFERVASAAEACGFQMPSLRFSDLSSDSLHRTWVEMQIKFLPNSETFLPGEHVLDSPDRWTPTTLPLSRLYRQMLVDTEGVFPWRGTEGELLKTAFNMQKYVSVLGDLERADVPRAEVEEQLQVRMADIRLEPRIPLTLAFPGVAPAYTSRLIKAGDAAALQPATPENASTEESAISFIATHRTMAEDSIGLVGSDIPREMFVALAELEKHWTRVPSGKAIQRLLRRINKAAEPLWTEDIVRAIGRASSLSVLSNFPVGLLTLPGDSSPLCCRLPISYSPLLPLTRSVQSELRGPRHVDLTAGFKVLIAECVADSDPVGQLSRAGWDAVEAMYSGQGTGATIQRIDVQTVGELRAAISEVQPAILVLSAHGFSNGMVAGIVIGQEKVLAQDLGPLPPVVIMSACHVSPRGRGEVSIVDLLERQGAVAVLGTQVPVDVRRNALLMMRFFLYLNEVIAGRGNQRSVLEVWQHVQCLNAVNDIAASSPKFLSWIMSPHTTGVSVLKEFMNVRSKGGLRGGSVYEDTERLLLELADEQGMASQVRAWLTTSGYVPESLFYNFMGRPGSVWLKPPTSRVQAE